MKTKGFIMLDKIENRSDLFAYLNSLRIILIDITSMSGYCQTDVGGTVWGAFDLYLKNLIEYNNKYSAGEDHYTEVYITISAQTGHKRIKMCFEGMLSDFVEEMRSFTKQARTELCLPSFEEEYAKEQEELRKSWIEHFGE